LAPPALFVFILREKNESCQFHGEEKLLLSPQIETLAEKKNFLKTIDKLR